MEKTRQQRMMRLLRRRFLIVVLLLCVVFLARGVWGVFEKERMASENRAEEEAQLAELGDREAQLRGSIEALKSERGVEEVLRKQYGMVRPGEGVVILLDATSTPPPLPPEQSWWQKVWKRLPW